MDLVERCQRRIAYGGKKAARARRWLLRWYRARDKGLGFRSFGVTAETIGHYHVTREGCRNFFRGVAGLEPYDRVKHGRRRNGLRA